MQRIHTSRWRTAALAAGLAALLWQPPGNAQTVTGSARAVQATVASPTGASTTMLADTGTLGGPSDAREASAIEGSIPSLLSGRALHATTIGWSDQVSSEASIAGLAMTVDGNTINADFVQARAISAGRRSNIAVDINGLTVNGNAIDVSGSVNQTVTIPNGIIIINERTGSVVNALHVVIDGVADVVIASARASAQ
jgi:hypothetical protein